jgi:hypothetical protein
MPSLRQAVSSARAPELLSKSRCDLGSSMPSLAQFGSRGGPPAAHSPASVERPGHPLFACVVGRRPNCRWRGRCRWRGVELADRAFRARVPVWRIYESGFASRGGLAIPASGTGAICASTIGRGRQPDHQTCHFCQGKSACPVAGGCGVAQGALASQLTAQARAEIEDQAGRLNSGLLTSWVSSTAAELLSGAGAPLPAVHRVSADGTGVRILFCFGRTCR